jgi:hypothetical protein
MFIFKLPFAVNPQWKSRNSSVQTGTITADPIDVQSAGSRRRQNYDSRRWWHSEATAQVDQVIDKNQWSREVCGGVQPVWPVVRPDGNKGGTNEGTEE